MQQRWFSIQKNAAQKFKISREVEGTKSGDFHLVNQADYRLFVTANGKRISPWHNLPVYPLKNKTNESKYLVSFVNEIPRGTVAKMEIATKEASNPIKQDVKKDKLRNYPFASLVNYGCIPQTWESPDHEFMDGYKGDNDPIDVCDVGSPVLESGQVVVAKVLGILGMIDEGEMDWKVIAINRNDPRSAYLNTIQDLERSQPGRVSSIVNWFKQYKVPDGKPLNEFAFDGAAKDADYAMDVIEKTHMSWRDTEAMTKHGLWVPKTMSEESLAEDEGQ